MAPTTPTPTPATRSRERPAGPSPETAGLPTERAWGPFVVAALALVLAALLNGDELLRTAERQPVGWEREVLVDLAAIPYEAGDASGLNRPRRWAEAILGEDGAGGVPAGRPTPPTTAPGRVDAPSADPTTTSTTTAGRRVPTVSAPLQLAVVGDSMMQVLGQSVVNGAAGDERIAATLEYRVSTGLTRPDYFDWPSRIADLLGSGPLDAVVVMFGANDAQGMVLPTGSEPFGTPAWLAQYRSRVGQLMDQLTASGVDTYWVGQPVMRSASFSGRMALLNEIYASEAASRGGVTYVDAWAVLSVDGEYAARIDDGGGPVEVRQTDGIHLSRAGGDRLAAVVLEALRADWRL